MGLALSQSGGFGEVDPEALPPALVAPRGVGRAMAELALHESLLDIRSRREAGPQRVPAKGKPPLPFRQVTPDPCRMGCALHQTRHVPVGQTNRGWGRPVPSALAVR